MKKLYISTMILLFVANIMSSFTPFVWDYIYDEKTISLLELSYFNAKIDLGGVTSFILQFIYVPIFLGLIFYIKFARTAFTVWIIFNIIFAPYLYGITVGAFVEGSFGYLVTILEGAILTMVYFSSVSREFEKKREAK